MKYITVQLADDTDRHGRLFNGNTQTWYNSNEFYQMASGSFHTRLINESVNGFVYYNDELGAAGGESSITDQFQDVHSATYHGNSLTML